MIKTPEFPFDWTLKNTIFTKDKGKVFSCFACGGGSSLGYKLAGFDVLGAMDIDPKMMKVYEANNKPQFSYVEGIQTFKNRQDLPKELFSLDILDGSPPCSSFSMAGARERHWGKEKVFREGQKKQVLDTLFFDFIDLANILRPKVVIAENVKGILQGGAKKYAIAIHKAFNEAGYYSSHYLLNAATMGVPQSRERAFFIAVRKDLAGPVTRKEGLFNETAINLDLGFDCPIIPYKQIRQEIGEQSAYNLSDKLRHYWKLTDPGNGFDQYHPKASFFGERKVSPENPVPTITTKKQIYDCLEERYLFNKEISLAGTFPQDFDTAGQNLGYIVGMSVPPVMMANVANQVYRQILKKLC